MRPTKFHLKAVPNHYLMHERYYTYWRTYFHSITQLTTDINVLYPVKTIIVLIHCLRVYLLTARHNLLLWCIVLFNNDILLFDRKQTFRIFFIYKLNLPKSHHNLLYFINIHTKMIDSSDPICDGCFIILTRRIRRIILS